MSRSTQKELFGSDPLPAQPLPWERANESDRLTAQVVVNRPLNTVFNYLVPNHLSELLEPGKRVKVPFGKGNRLIAGYCVGLNDPPKAIRKLKEVHSVLDQEPLLTTRMLELTRWIAERYLCAWGQVLDAVVPAGVKKKSGTREALFFHLDDKVASDLDLNLPQKQRAIVEFLLKSEQPLRADEIRQAVGCGPGPISGLRKKGLIHASRQRSHHFDIETEVVPREEDLTLNSDQQCALDEILQQLRQSQYRTLLLHGVTGSGKTEVYMQAIREVVGYGRQAIVLVPEISLTPQTIRRFRSRFDSVAVLHSHLSDAERHWHWQQIAQGRVQVIVGARSAVFAPTPHLGLIVIDEEHESSFKQETIPRYHAREVARKRAELDGIPLVLGTATPTLESWFRVLQKQEGQSNDRLLSLPNRVAKRPLPPVTIVDIRNDPTIVKGHAIGRTLTSTMQSALRDDGQIILFLNLRGFSPTVWCRSCGDGVKCPRCDVTLTLHKDRNTVLCHFCDYETAPPSRCPHCDQPGIRYFGVGTQKLEKEVQAKFPGVKCLRMDSDSMSKHGSHDVALASFGCGDVRILLGTQMIAKGLDFPNVTLVGVVDADTMLHQPDLRATERSFQLIAQVAGRTGRSERGGRVIVQTTSPDEPAIQLAAQHDFVKFATTELGHRRELLAPPFSHLARVIIRGPREELVQAVSTEMAELIRQTNERRDSKVRVLGPAPAPIAKLKDNYRYHFQLAAENTLAIRELWNALSDQLPATRGVEFVIDVDPMNMR